MAKIHDYPASSQVSPNDLVLLDVPNGSSYVNKSASLKNLVNGVLSVYTFSGRLLNSGTSSIAGYGIATIQMLNGNAFIDFSLKITTEDSSANSDFTYGINRDYLTSTVGKSITPVTGGLITFYTPDGAIKMSHIGYGGTMNRQGQFWVPARVYTTEGAVGSWSAATWPVNTLITGNIIGTYSL